MTTPNKPTIGVVLLPNLAAALAQAGYDVVAGDDYRTAATSIRAALNERGPFPVFCSDIRWPGFRTWVGSIGGLSLPVTVIRVADGDPNLEFEGVARIINTPVALSDAVGGLALPDNYAGLVVHPDATIRVDAPAAPSPASRAHDVAPAPVDTPAAAVALVPEPAATAPALAPAQAFEPIPSPAASEPTTTEVTAEITAGVAAEADPWEEATAVVAPSLVVPSLVAPMVGEARTVGDAQSTPAPFEPTPAPVAAPAVVAPAPDPWEEATATVSAPAPALATVAVPAQSPVEAMVEQPVEQPVEPAVAVQPFQQAPLFTSPVVAPPVFDPTPEPATSAVPVDAAPVVFGSLDEEPPAAPAPAPVFAPPVVEQPQPVTAPAPVFAPPLHAQQTEPQYREPVAQAQVFAPAPVEQPVEQTQVFTPPPVTQPVSQPVVAPAIAPAFTPAAPVATGAPHETYDSRTAGPAAGLGAAKVVFATAGKGGVGKTSTAMALADLAARSGLRVVLVDGNFGQGGVRTNLRIGASALPSIYDYAITRDARQALIDPNRLADARGFSATRFGFAVVTAPPPHLTDPAVVTPQVYVDLVTELSHVADLIVIDTQIIEPREKPEAIVAEFIDPMLTAGAYQIAITDLSGEGITNLLSRLKATAGLGVDQSRTLSMVNRAPADARSNFDDLIAALGENSTFIGLCYADTGVHAAMAGGQTGLEADAFRSLMSAALGHLNPAWASSALGGQDEEIAGRKRKRSGGLFGRRKG